MQAVKQVDGAKYYDNDQAYLKFIQVEKQRLQEKPYLKLTGEEYKLPT